MGVTYYKVVFYSFPFLVMMKKKKKETSALSPWGILGVLLINVNGLPDLRELLQDGESELEGSWQRHSQ